MPEFLPLERLIRENLRRLNLDQGVKSRQSLSLWERVAGETVAEATQADSIRDGLLFVYTRSSAWSQELSLLKEALIKRINEELGQEIVKDIRFQVKRFRTKREAASGEASVLTARVLTDEEKAAVHALTERLEGPTADRLNSVVAAHLRHTADSPRCPGCGAPLHAGETICPFCRT